MTWDGMGAFHTGISTPMKDWDRKDVGYDRCINHKPLFPTQETRHPKDTMVSLIMHIIRVGASAKGIFHPLKDRDRNDVGYDRCINHKPLPNPKKPSP